MNTFFPTDVATTPSCSPSSMYAASNLGRSDLARPLLKSISLSPSPSLPFFHIYVLSGLASPLHLFPSPSGAPFVSSCHRFLLPSTAYKDAGNLFILASRNGMPRSVEEEAAGARLPTLPLLVCRRTVLAEIPSSLASPSPSFTASFLPRFPLAFSPSLSRPLFPFKCTLVAKFSQLTLPPEYSALERTTITRLHRAE